MQELSMNISDVARNSVNAGASCITISVICNKNDDLLTITIEDNGKGMNSETLQKVTDPFFTTRTTRDVGLGVPLFKMAAEMAGGKFEISSEEGKGTAVYASFVYSHIDRAPMGELAESIGQFICLNEEIDIRFTYGIGDSKFEVSSAELTSVLDGVPLNTPQIMLFVCGYLKDNMNNLEQ